VLFATPPVKVGCPRDSADPGCSLAGSALGQEEQFWPPRLSGRCLIGLWTSAGAIRNG